MSARDVSPQLTQEPPSIEAQDPSIRAALLAAIVDSSSDAIISKTLDGRIRSWNAGASRIFGYSAEEMIGRPITAIIPPELHEEERHILEQVRSGRRIEHFDTIRVAKDGRRIPISLTVSPVRDSQGVIVGASKVARDFSERKRAELALLESEKRLAAEAEALAKLNELSTRLWRSRSLQTGLDEILAAVIELLGAEKGNIQLLNADGSLSIVAQRGFEPEFLEVANAAGHRSLVSTPLMSADGKALGIVSTHFRLIHRPSEQELRRLDLYLRQAGDFIQRCKLELVLQQSEEALREADRRKDEFLALLAHELRNPLAPIRYSLAANRKPDRTPEDRKAADEIIERQVAHMSRLLDDLLDVSRITRSALELKTGPTELQRVIASAIETARPILDSKHHHLELELPADPVWLEADAVRLSQVFSNLLINSSKYTDPGGHIRLRAVREKAEIVIAIRDDGIGISADMLPRLFTMFSQAESALVRSEGGLGIGLSLVRGIVALHGGTVEAHSDGEGSGSEFTVRLPGTRSIEAPPDSAEPADAPATGAGMKILVVDDNRDAADTCAALLDLSGHHVRTAYTGQSAFEIAQAFRPHAILMDIGLPDLDGYQLAAKVRQAPWGHAIMLIAVTGWGQDADRRRAVEAGFDHHLTKPIAAEEVESLLQSLRPHPQV